MNNKWARFISKIQVKWNSFYVWWILKKVEFKIKLKFKDT